MRRWNSVRTIDRGRGASSISSPGYLTSVVKAERRLWINFKTLPFAQVNPSELVNAPTQCGYTNWVNTTAKCHTTTVSLIFYLVNDSWQREDIEWYCYLSIFCPTESCLVECVKSRNRQEEKDQDLPDIATDIKTKLHRRWSCGSRLMERSREEDGSNVHRLHEWTGRPRGGRPMVSNGRSRDLEMNSWSYNCSTPVADMSVLDWLILACLIGIL